MRASKSLMVGWGGGGLFDYSVTPGPSFGAPDNECWILGLTWFWTLTRTLTWTWDRTWSLTIWRSGVLLVYWKMTFCPKFIRCFGLLFVLKLEILNTLPYKGQVLGGIGLIAIEVLQLFLYNKSMYNPSLTFRIMVHCSFSYVLTVFPHWLINSIIVKLLALT